MFSRVAESDILSKLQKTSFLFFFPMGVIKAPTLLECHEDKATQDSAHEAESSPDTTSVQTRVSGEQKSF